MTLFRSRIAAGACLAAGLLASRAEARKFDFNDAKAGACIGGTFGFNRVQKTPFAPGQPDTVGFPDFSGTSSGYSGSVGAVFSSQNRFSLKLGVELLYAGKAKDVEGKDASSQVLLSETSEALGVMPEAVAEIHLVRREGLRASLGGGAGWMKASIKNQVDMTGAGESQLGVGDYVEEGEGAAVTGKLYGSLEMILVDNCTVSFQAGYRYAIIREFNHARDAVLPAPLGAVSQGSPMLNADGTRRTVDFSGPYGGVQLSFWMW